MAYQITLTDEEYAALSAAAAREGKTVEALAHEALAARYPAATNGAVTEREFLEQLYREGFIENIPTGEPDSPEEEAELDEIARRIGSDKPWLSEMVIEDRGPR